MSWLLLPGGVVMPDVRPDKSFTGDHTDREYDMQVRARHKEYLDSFRELYCPEMLESIHFPNHDYPWKAYVKRADLAAAYAKTVMGIDYRKFKPESVAKHPTDSTRTKYLLPWKKAHQLHSLYNSLWGTMLTHGDGTSVFNGMGSGTGYMTRAVGDLDKPNAGYCAGLNPTHWFPSNLAKPGQPEKCFDCGTDKATYIKERDERRAARKASTKGGNYGGPAGSAGTITYPGSPGWGDPAWETGKAVFPSGTSQWQASQWGSLSSSNAGGAPLANTSHHGLGFPTPASDQDDDDEEAYWSAVESAPASPDTEDFAGIIARASTFDLTIWSNEMPEIADAAQAELDSRADALAAAQAGDMPPAPQHPGQSKRSQKRARRAARRRQRSR